MIDRRNFIKRLWPLALLTANPAFAFDLFKALDPEGKSKDIQKAKTIFEGVGSIVSSAIRR